ncbi:tetratricopeptide repeat protein [Salininema proteolyticum]|uniref:Tetratricopeptide repeat protein n=1 Tax=Salininema proteolyticum TaxID=1607685 RepID=A0ABV8TV52_9ACTN
MDSAPRPDENPAAPEPLSSLLTASQELRVRAWNGEDVRAESSEAFDRAVGLVHGDGAQWAAAAAANALVAQYGNFESEEEGALYVRRCGNFLDLLNGLPSEPWVHGRKAMIHAVVADFAAAPGELKDGLRKAYEAAVASGEPDLVCRTAHSYALHLAYDDTETPADEGFPAAREVFAVAREHCAEGEDPDLVCHIHLHSAIVAEALGEVLEASRLARTAIAAGVADESPLNVGHAHAIVAEAALHRGDPHAAESHSRSALLLGERVAADQPWLVLTAHFGLAQAGLALERHEEALAHAREALRLYDDGVRTTASATFSFDVWETIAGLHEGMEDFDSAVEALVKGAAVAEEAGYMPRAAQMIRRRTWILWETGGVLGNFGDRCEEFSDLVQRLAVESKEFERNPDYSHLCGLELAETLDQRSQLKEAMMDLLTEYGEDGMAVSVDEAQAALWDDLIDDCHSAWQGFVLNPMRDEDRIIGTGLRLIALFCYSRRPRAALEVAAEVREVFADIGDPVVIDGLNDRIENLRGLVRSVEGDDLA